MLSHAKYQLTVFAFDDHTYTCTLSPLLFQPPIPLKGAPSWNNPHQPPNLHNLYSQVVPPAKGEWPRFAAEGVGSGG